MRRLPSPSAAIAVLVLACALAAAPAAALEFGVEGGAGNIHFPRDEVAPTGGTGPFPATNYVFDGSAWALMPLGEDASLRLGFDMDAVLRNSASALVLFERGPARIAVGPFVGFLNAGTPFNAGLSTTIRFQWPGVAFVSARSDGGLSLGLVPGAASDPQALAEISAGFYTPNAIVAASVIGKRFEETDAAGELVADSLTSYLVTVDIYKKNVPYTLLWTLGYQVRSRYFAAGGSDALGSLVLGARIGVNAMPGVKTWMELQSGVFTFGIDDLAGRSPTAASFMFEAKAGLSMEWESASKTFAGWAEASRRRQAERARLAAEKAAAEAAAAQVAAPAAETPPAAAEPPAP